MASYTRKGDRPRRPGEPVVAWALATGRIGPERADYWTQQVAASASAATGVLERLAPGCAPLTGRTGGELTEDDDEMEGVFSRRHVAAAAEDLDEPDDTYDALFGASDRAKAERHLEHLHNIASGNAIGARITQKRARELIEQYAQGNSVAAAVPGDGLQPDSRIPVPADRARAVLASLDRATDVRWAR